MNYDTFTIESESYRKAFWNTMMKGKGVPYSIMEKGNA